MKTRLSAFLSAILLTALISASEDPFGRLGFLLGAWSGTGSGFGSDSSKIEAQYQYLMDGEYILATHDSRFEPTPSKPEGEHHMDYGIISFDKHRDKIVYRQFNIEGYVNQYVLSDSLSTSNKLVFLTETIENFVPGGKARWSIEKISDDHIITSFDVSFPGKQYACFGTNELIKIEPK